MNKLEIKTIHSAVKFGFTFSGDSFFSSYIQAKRTINSLVKRGFLTPKDGGFGAMEYTPTNKAHDFVKYGVVFN